MKGGQAPGKVIGTMDAADVNFVWNTYQTGKG